MVFELYLPYGLSFKMYLQCKMMNSKEREILNFVKENPLLSSKKIHEEASLDIGYATVKRILTKLVSNHLIISMSLLVSGQLSG